MNTPKFLMVEFYPGPFSGLVDKTEYELEDLNIKDRTGYYGPRLDKIESEVLALAIGHTKVIHTNCKNYRIEITRIK